MTELIIAEKPDAAKNIAFALADSNALKKNIAGVPYYELSHNGKDIIVASAVGHLYTVAPVKKHYNYPQFDILWTENYKVDKGASYTKKYVDALRKVASECDEFTVATDYDIEGEVIGYNVIHHICKKKDGFRMKFSTLTKGDIVEAYEEKQKTLDWGQVHAGITRHELDWFYGINLSSALMSAVKAAGSFKVLSSGRVQGPALKLLCDREKEIKAFIPTPYWQLHMLLKVKGQEIECWHEQDKILDEKQAQSLFIQSVSSKNSSSISNPSISEFSAVVSKVDKKEFKQKAPEPFDLTSFQVECYRVHKISPKETLAIAQELYIAGFISYPRTSSQKLPAKIGYKKILSGLQKIPQYQNSASFLLSKQTLIPNEGKKVDDAHPAIFPTGIIPSGLNLRAEKVYDLIAHRFMATFGEPALRETLIVNLDLNSVKYIAKGIHTKSKGWHELYGPYAIFDEIILPPIQVGEKFKDPTIEKLAKETKPPKRYTQASIISELDKRNLGTKATRAQIIENLYQRGYVNSKSMEATDLGLRICETLEKYSPLILDEQLTRNFEEELEGIRHGSIKPVQTIAEAKELLTKILVEFKKKEFEIGTELKQADWDSKNAMITVGECPTCGKGQLKIRVGKYGKFVGCSSYPDCKTIFSLPQGAKVEPAKKECTVCNHPLIALAIPNRGSRNMCINPDCSSKKTQAEQTAADEGTKAYSEEGMTCPACNEGKMVLRTSFYGSFLGCNKYPACKTMMKIIDGKVDTNFITKAANAPNTPSKKPMKFAPKRKVFQGPSAFNSGQIATTKTSGVAAKIKSAKAAKPKKKK